MAIYKKCYFIFITGALGYCLLEVLWRGYTHPSMGIAGGLCLIGIYYISKLNTSYVFRAFLSAILITSVEFIFGIFLNQIMKLNIWDYSDMPLNILGQVCFSFSFLWFVLSYCVIFLLDLRKKKICEKSSRFSSPMPLPGSVNILSRIITHFSSSNK